MRSLQKIADHCEASFVGSSSFSYSIGVDTTNLQDHFVDSGDALTTKDSQGNSNATEVKSD